MNTNQHGVEVGASIHNHLPDTEQVAVDKLWLLLLQEVGRPLLENVVGLVTEIVFTVLKEKQALSQCASSSGSDHEVDVGEGAGNEVEDVLEDGVQLTGSVLRQLGEIQEGDVALLVSLRLLQVLGALVDGVVDELGEVAGAYSNEMTKSLRIGSRVKCRTFDLSTMTVSESWLADFRKYRKV